MQTHYGLSAQDYLQLYICNKKAFKNISAEVLSFRVSKEYPTQTVSQRPNSSQENLTQGHVLSTAELSSSGHTEAGSQEKSIIEPLPHRCPAL